MHRFESIKVVQNLSKSNPSKRKLALLLYIFITNQFVINSIMKKLITLFLVLIAGASIHAAIINGVCTKDLSWSLNTDDGILTLTGRGDMTKSSYAPLTESPWYDYRSYIKFVSLPEGLTSIGRLAFNGCKGLTSVTIPDSVTVIGNMLSLFAQV